MTFNEIIINHLHSLFNKNKMNTSESKAVKMDIYSKAMEKHKKRENNKNFELPFVQKRYDFIVEALKYTKHSKSRDKLIKNKKLYDETISNK